MGNAWVRGPGSARHFQLHEHWDAASLPGDAGTERDELLAEIEEADLTLEETYTYGKFVPIPKPENGKRVKVTMGRACVFVESDGQMTLWDTNEKAEPYEPFGGEENNESV
jgi:hypothetical protein